jgi:hypothetical protein
VVLEGLTKLDADAAKVLAAFRVEALAFPHLNTLAPAAANALVEFKGTSLCLDGLARLDPDSAKAIAGFRGEFLLLPRLSTLDAATAKALAQFDGGTLRLNKLIELDTDGEKVLRANAKIEFVDIDETRFDYLE